jgi:hypothetical protein
MAAPHAISACSPGEPVAIDLIAMEAEQGDHPGAPAEVQELQAPLLAPPGLAHLRRYTAGVG